MRRTFLLLTVAAMLATMLALAGPSLAKDTEAKEETYIDKVEVRQYAAARLPTPEDPEQRGSWFRGSATDSEDHRDPGLEGGLDTSITYTGGAPSSGGTNELTGGSWILCSKGFEKPPLDTSFNPPKLIEPVCKPDTDPNTQIALKGTWSSGTAKWDEGAGLSKCLAQPVYAGVAEVEGELTVIGGTVKGKTVTGGSGKFEGTLDHRPLALPVDMQFPCLVNGAPNPDRFPIVTGTIELKF